MQCTVHAAFMHVCVHVCNVYESVLTTECTVYSIVSHDALILCLEFT